jgi:four helix bundle protein
MRVEGYQKLQVWHKAMELCEKIYALTAMLPAQERFNLVSQLCRASVSVASNIAEGYGRQATGDYRHHL